MSDKSFQVIVLGILFEHAFEHAICPGDCDLKLQCPCYRPVYVLLSAAKIDVCVKTCIVVMFLGILFELAL